MRHLLAVDDLAQLARAGAPNLRAGIEVMLDLTQSFVEVTQREIPKVPALRGRTIVSLFYEDSTRTRLSFETAAKRLGVDTMTFSVATSSVKKGESLLDTVQTIEAMGVDAIVVRHAAAGAAHRVASRRRRSSTRSRCGVTAVPRSTAAASRSSATSRTRALPAATSSRSTRSAATSRSSARPR